MISVQLFANYSALLESALNVTYSNIKAISFIIPSLNTIYDVDTLSLSWEYSLIVCQSWGQILHRVTYKNFL